MAKKANKKGRPISGWVILNKPKEMGSTEAVAKIKWLYNAEKAGHAGTLDPLASGLLPIALGEATKTVPYVMEGTKVYRFTVAWGEERSTDDLEGTVTHSSDNRPNKESILNILPHYTGVISQVPPQFSAIKIAGERAYDIARGGEKIEIPSREVEIDVLELMEINAKGHAVFEVECGKGTYVRSLARDMGRELGCYGYIVDLQRIEVSPFTQDDFIELETLEHSSPRVEAQRKLEADIEKQKAATKEETSQHKKKQFRPRLSQEALAQLDFDELDALLIETGAALECLSQYPIQEAQAVRIRNGNPILLRGQAVPTEEEEAVVTYADKVLALGSIEKGSFKPKRVFTS